MLGDYPFCFGPDFLHVLIFILCLAIVKVCMHLLFHVSEGLTYLAFSAE